MQEVYFGEIQHGHMEQVGYDTYCKLLDEVVKEMQGIKVKEEKDIQIDMNVSSFIPDEYIENSSQKIEIYQDIALSKNEEDLANVIDEIIDRYGSMPKEVENLIEVARIKILARKACAIKVVQKERSIMVILDKDNIKINEEIVNNLVKKYGIDIRFSPGVEPYITLKIGEMSEERVVQKIKGLLQSIIV